MAKFPLGIGGIELRTSKPFVAYMKSGNKVIAVEEIMRNKYGDPLYSQYHVIDNDPTDEEIFKVMLANPSDEKVTIPAYTVEEIHHPSKDS